MPGFRKNTLLFFICFLFRSVSTVAQTDTLTSEDEKWYKFHSKLQFAGSIGFVSAGAGFTFNRDHIESDLMAGYVPKAIGGEYIVTLTIKNTFYLLNIASEKLDVKIYPLGIGGFFNYTFGNQYETFYPDYYPDGYYWWDSAIRLGFFLGGKVTRQLPKELSPTAVSAYYELGSNDLYLVSYLQNTKYLKPYDILNLAIGLKVTF